MDREMFEGIGVPPTAKKEFPAWASEVMQALERSKVTLRRMEYNPSESSKPEYRVAIFRPGSWWQTYFTGKEGVVAFWGDLHEDLPELGSMFWVGKVHTDLMEFFTKYAKRITFNNTSYFGLANGVFDGTTVHDTPTAYLDYPTQRYAPLPYDPSINPTPQFHAFFEEMDARQRAIRNWFVGNAMLGGKGLLMTVGESSTGKSLFADSFSELLGSGAQTFKLTRKWNNFTTGKFENTTYLLDEDSKGEKKDAKANYDYLSSMATGGTVDMEVKGGKLFSSKNYGAMEVISNTPIPLPFEASLVRRILFLPYDYVTPKPPNDHFAAKVRGDKQAWLNYAIDCAIGVNSGTIPRPVLDKYQLRMWVYWLSHTEHYAQMCLQERELLSYGLYKKACNDNFQPSKTRTSEEDYQQIIDGLGMIQNLYDGDMEDVNEIFKVNWKQYKEQLRKEHINGEPQTLF